MIMDIKTVPVKVKVVSKSAWYEIKVTQNGRTIRHFEVRGHGTAVRKLSNSVIDLWHIEGYEASFKPIGMREDDPTVPAVIDKLAERKA
jgi:hypothetical protein